MATIAIIGALEKEIMQIKEELSNVCMVQEAGLNVVSGELDGLSIVATTAGMGTVNAAAATQHLISKYAPQAVVFSGLLSVALSTLRQMQPPRTRAQSSSWSARLPRVTAL